MTDFKSQLNGRFYEVIAKSVSSCIAVLKVGLPQQEMAKKDSQICVGLITKFQVLFLVIMNMQTG